MNIFSEGPFTSFPPWIYICFSIQQSLVSKPAFLTESYDNRDIFFPLTPTFFLFFWENVQFFRYIFIFTSVYKILQLKKFLFLRYKKVEFLFWKTSFSTSVLSTQKERYIEQIFVLNNMKSCYYCWYFGKIYKIFKNIFIFYQMIEGSTKFWYFVQQI